MSYPGHSVGGSYFSVEKQSVYSTAPDNWAICVYMCACACICLQVQSSWMFVYICVCMYWLIELNTLCDFLRNTKHGDLIWSSFRFTKHNFLSCRLNVPSWMWFPEMSPILNDAERNSAFPLRFYESFCCRTTSWFGEINWQRLHWIKKFQGFIILISFLRTKYPCIVKGLVISDVNSFLFSRISKIFNHQWIN